MSITVPLQKVLRSENTGLATMYSLKLYFSTPKFQLFYGSISLLKFLLCGGIATMLSLTL